MDNRPPMLVESDYKSWKIRIKRYIHEGQGAAAVQVTIDKTDEEFTVIENNKELADIQATNILGSGKSLQQTKEELFNEYERFCAIRNESIHDYFVCFHKLINDMKITQLDILAHQMNTKLSRNKSSPQAFADPLAYLTSTTHHLTPTQPTNPSPSTPSLILPPQPAAQSSNDAMLETMNQIVNLLSGNVGNTGTRGTQSYGQVTDNKGKLVICYNSKEKGAVLDAEAEAFLADVECTAPYDRPLAIMTTNIFEVSHEDTYDSDVDEGPHAAAAFMANLSSTSGTNGATTSHVNEVHTDDNQIFDNVNHMLAHEMHREEHLDFDVESDIDDNTIPYHQYQLDSKVQDVPTKVSSVSPGVSMITILDDLRNQLDGNLKVNQEQSMVNDSLRAELARCKLEIQTLERNKVKHDLDMTIVQRNKRNAELEQENMLLKSNLSQKVESINSLKTESKKVLSEKKDLEERYLEEIVCLKNANKVATGILQKIQQPTQTILMLTKQPKLATHDLHKTALSSSNMWYAKQAKIAQPTLHDGHALLKPSIPLLECMTVKNH
nr:hypothetical protein [Tanacetum cinerariifolium]